MAFNLNTSKKSEVNLYSDLINEQISIYGIPVLYIYTEKKNKDVVFKDFSHMELKEFESIPENLKKEIYVLPENPEDWDGDTIFNNFGLYNQWTQHLFISRKTILELYPNFDEIGRSVMLNSLLVLPSSAVLEITHMETYTPGINNLWAFADENSVYMLHVKIYDHNIADEGINEYKDKITLTESGTPQTEENTIFETDQEVDTSGIDKFFEELQKEKEIIDSISDKTSEENMESNPGLNPNNTDTVFGSLS